MCNIQLFLLAVLLPWGLCSGTDCGWPGLPRHGLLNGSSDERREFFFPNSTKVRYSCQGEGQKLFGSEVRECVNGRWSGSLPWCASNIIRNKKVAVEIHSSHSDETTLTFPTGITDGITTDNDKSPCVWVTGGEKHIIHLIENEEHLIHRMLIHTKNHFPVIGNDWDIDVPRHWSYQVTDITPSPAMIVINDNLETVTELSIGIESRDPFEICEVELYAQTEKFECGSPEIPANGRVNLSSSEHGHVATYSCNSEYQIDGPIQRTCNGTQWTGNAPVCIPNHAPEELVTDIPSTSSKATRESKHDQVNGVSPQNTAIFHNWTLGELLLLLCFLIFVLLIVSGAFFCLLRKMRRGNK